jgi:hypothetical protein
MPVKINSSGGGSVTLAAASTASDFTLTIPAQTGTAVTTASSAAVTPAMLSGGAPSWDGSGNLSFNSGYGLAAVAYGCRAWVNFNGTGTVAIRASGNVSSITDNGTGDYTVNFTTAMPDANYSVVSIVRRDETIGNNSGYASVRNVASAVVAGSARMFTVLPASPATGLDMEAVFVSIFR